MESCATESSRPLALWVGPESTVNRVGDAYTDQLVQSGFDRRLEDLDRLASLGATRIRMPLLWERIAPGDLRDADWRWSDERMGRLRALGLPPIVGLMHHGSGPRDTSLLDPALPVRLAAFARAVAERYPWVDAWTPINEPLTTARFAALYGHWYPHRRDDASFLRALLLQTKATVAAMCAVRCVNPRAWLVQTEDLGYTSATAPLQYQADFENHRRWLSLDLLHGRVDRSHPLWDYLSRHLSAGELLAQSECPCPPDIIGVNAYVTSERFLDHRLARHPQHTHGGNGRDRYADVEAVRAGEAPIGGFAARLREAHRRYDAPLAITEAHLGCTREEQMRWLLSAWRAAEALRDEGADVRAVTAWAAFGATDWDSLLTVRRGHYEPGLWDVRAPQPRATALTRLARDLARGTSTSRHPLLALPGWWERADCGRPAHAEPIAHGGTRPDDPPPLLVTGATGTLGRAFARHCLVRGVPYRLSRRQDLDIADVGSVAAALARWRPWAVVNTAGFVRVDDAEIGSALQDCWRDNAMGAELLARACGAAGIPLVNFSSDLVFDGSKASPYVESDAPQPLNAYGRAKRAAEVAALEHCPLALVVRTAAFFGPWDQHNFVTCALDTLRGGSEVFAASDQWITPTYVPHLVDATLDLLIDGEVGIVHLTNRIDDGRGAISWAGFARAAVAAAGLDPAGVHAVAARGRGQHARRPVNAALASERLWPLPPLSRAIDDYVRDAGVSVENASTARTADRDTGAPFATATTHMMR